MNHQKQHDMAADIGAGFGMFVDGLLRGRHNKALLNGSVAVAALDIGVPDSLSWQSLDISRMVVNNQLVFEGGDTSYLAHSLFGEGKFLGFDWADFIGQLRGNPSAHHVPIYKDMSSELSFNPEAPLENVAEAAGSTGLAGQSLAQSLGLPDLPYMEFAHLAHLGIALYDTGRTFQEVWKETADYYKARGSDPLSHGMALAGHLGKAITHPDLLHTLAARGTMLTVMGLLHPLGGVVAIGVSYLMMHLVHSAFGVLERNKDTIRQIENVPVLRAIYNASGIKEWAERDLEKPANATPSEIMDPYQETELLPQGSVHKAQVDGTMRPASPLHAISQSG